MTAQKKKRKEKTWTWRGWGLRNKTDGFVFTYCKELAEEYAANWKGGSLVRIVAKVTEVRR